MTASVIETTWSEWRRLRLARVAPTVADWLRDQGSLTMRLKSRCDESFRVQVLSQGWGRPGLSERKLLQMRPGELAVVREVRLLCDGEPWVFARTLIPASSLQGQTRKLTLLGERPLGHVLFADPQTRRVVMQMARLQPRHRLYRRALAGLEGAPGELWGRRTLFHLAGRPLLVNEIFLPRLWEREAR